MSGLSLAFLGTFRAEFNGRSLTHFRTKTAQALLIYLACQPEAHQREHLMALLWPGMPQPSAQKNLRQSLYLLRQAIPEIEAKSGQGRVPFFRADRQIVQVNPDGRYDLDCQAFAQYLKQDEALWPEAVALYRGDFLADFYLADSVPFEEWVQARRGHWRRQVLNALETLTEWALTAGDLKTAEQYARRQLDIDNLREPGHRQLMAILARDGRRVDALSQYESLAHLLQTELAVEPSAETQALSEAIRSDNIDKVTGRQGDEVTVTPSPPRHVTMSPPHNLPAQPTPLIGRERELAELDELLTSPDTRLITIVGPGGMGKTRLALACAEQCLGVSRTSPDLYPNGVFFVNLAPLSEVEQIIPALVQNLQFPLQVDDPRLPRQQVLDYLSRKRMLLVMDNFEHLLDGVDLLAEVAQAAPDIRILVTSRDRLHLRLEQVYLLQGLAFPDMTAGAASGMQADVLAYTAVQLFRQCARRNQPDFDLQSAEDLAEAARICRLIAGMPLAIELAAAWVDTLSLADITAEIQQSLNFLETGRRDMPARHRSVRATIDTSWKRLAKHEQTILTQFSVFRGGFTRESVQAVTGASLVLLSRLVNKSFLQYDRENNRYQIHELLRQFAGEKLAQIPDEETAVRDRHSATYCNFLHAHTEMWHTDQQLETLTAVTLEAENARLALNWALAQGDWQRLGQAIDCWGWFLDWQGRSVDGESFYQTIIDKAEVEDARESAIPAEGIRVWVKARAWLDWFGEDYRNIENNFEQNLVLLARPQLAGQDTRREKVFVHWQNAVLMSVIAPEEARPLYEQVLTEYQALDDQWGIAECLLGLGIIDLDTGYFTSALERLQAANRMYRERGDHKRAVINLSFLGIVHMDLGRLNDAERLHQEAISRSQEIGFKGGLGWRKATLAQTLMCQGRLEEALQMAYESLVTAEEHGSSIHERDTACLTICDVQIYAGQYEQAQQGLARVSHLVNIKGNISREAWISHLQGVLAVIDSSFAEAQSVFATSLSLWHSTYPHHFVTPLVGLGLATFRLGQLSSARQYLAEALASALPYKSAIPALAALPVIALLLAANADTVRAVEIWALAKCHPFIANSKWFEDVAGHELEALTASLPTKVATAASERGQELDLWATAEVLLAELKQEDNA